jgi:ankyrin repeat protein
MSELKIYRNKNIGEFASFPKNLADDSSRLDALYLASNFDKLRTKSVAAIRKSKHFASTVNAWEKKLTGVDASDLAAVAKTLGFDVEVFNPLASSEPQTLFSGGGRSKRKAQLLQVKKGVYKPMKAGAIIDELPPDMMRDVVGRLDGLDRASLSQVSREVREDTLAALPPQTKLWKAVDTGNIKLLQTALEEGADVNAKRNDGSVNAIRKNDGSTPLHVSVENGHLDVVKYLIKAGADVNYNNYNNKWKTPIHSPLHISILWGYQEIAEALIEAGAEVNAKQVDGSSPLHWSVEYGHLKITQALIKAGADVNAEMKNGNTPLHICAKVGDLEVVRALIDKGADVNAKGDDGWDPLHFSALNGHLEVVRYLIEKGADVNAKADSGGTPLHRSAQNGNLEIARALIDKGADVNVPMNDGETPLHSSARNGNLEIARALIDKGANVNARNIIGRTPLDYGNAEFKRNVRPRQGEDDDQGQGRNVRQRVGGGTNEGADIDVDFNADSRGTGYGEDDAALAKAIEVLFAKMRNLNMKRKLRATLAL